MKNGSLAHFKRMQEKLVKFFIKQNLIVTEHQ